MTNRMKHFKLTEKTKFNSLGIKLFRIEATVDSKYAKKGDKGGWIEKESNLDGDAWVYGDAEVYGNARVTSIVFTSTFKYNLTLTDLHIKYGCVQKSIDEWIEWLDSDEIIETPRDSDEFRIIEMSLRLAIEQNRQLNKKTK